MSGRGEDAMVGTRLGPYEVTAKLGEGGMGEVYRATDTRLRRAVAIKVLPKAFTADRERLLRFEREAQLLAQLHHPNIASIFGLEPVDGGQALVMELVEGEDLAALIARGPLPLAEALSIARQIAEALEAAHERGIVHRDLKPQNVKVRGDGTVKVLDFGLAKAMEAGDGSAAASGALASPALANSPTLTSARGTELGVVLGTAAYMSPEQARGGAVDKRADIWAFGVVLFEMLTGRRLFAGESVSDVLAGVLRDEVHLDALPANTPAELRRLLRRCLERVPANRLRDIGDARLALVDCQTGAGEPTAAPGGPRGTLTGWRSWAPVAAAALLAGLVGYLVGARREPAASMGATRGQHRFVVATAGRGPDDSHAIAPDGERVAYTADGGLWLRNLTELAPLRLAGADGAVDPFWSPDGRQLGFARDRVLWRIDLEGSPPRRVCELPDGTFEGGSWGDDDTIVFAIATGGWSGDLHACPADGGAARTVLVPQRVGLRASRPQVLPGGAGVLFVLHDSNDLGEVRLLANGDTRVLVSSPRQVNGAVMAPGGRLYYDVERSVGSDVWSLRFDEALKKPIGEPVLVAEGGALPSVAADGALLFAVRDEAPWRLAWVDRGGVVAPVGEPFAINAADLLLQLAPDDRAASLVLQGEQRARIGELWIADLASGTRRRQPLGFEVYSAIWSPGGRELFATRKGRAAVLPLSGGEAPRELVFPTTLFQPRYAPDGRWVVAYGIAPETGRDLWRVAADGGAPAEALLREPGQQANPDVSPDGRFLAYQSDESGRREVYVRPYPMGSRKWQVSSAGGVSPCWNRRGGELVWASGDDLWGAAVETAGGELVVGTPRLLVRGGPLGLELAAGQRYYSRNFDLSADGSRFLVATRTAAPRNEVVYVARPVVGRDS